MNWIKTFLAVLVLSLCAASQTSILPTNNLWQGTNTYDGGVVFESTSVFAGVLFARNIENLYYADQYGSIQATINALPAAGGVVVLPSNYTETITSPIVLGGGVGVSSVIILGYPGATITCNVTTGTYCIGIHTNSGLVGFEPWANTGGSFQILGGTIMNVTNMVQNLDLPQASIVLEKIWIENSSSAPTNACLLLDSLGNMTIVRDVTIVCRGAVGWLLQSTSGFTGPFTMDNVWSLSGTGSPAAGTIPCEIKNTGNSLVGIVILGGACNDAATGEPSLWVNGNGHIGATRGINIENYNEVLCANTGSSAIMLTDVWDVDIHGASGVCNGSGGTNNHGLTITQASAGGVREVVVTATQLQALGGGCVINNTITGECGPGNVNTQSNIGFYKYSGDSTLAPTTFIGGSLFQILNSTGGGAFNTEVTLNNSFFTVVPPLVVNSEQSFVGQAACYTTSGILGHCTSVVSSSGACTCTQ
jgi:hypothetical protein